MVPGGTPEPGFINVYETESKDPEQELKIVEEIASYGKQLGRAVEALQVLVSHTDSSRFDQDERRALGRFSEMSREIAQAKGARLAPTEQDLGRLLDKIRDLKDRDSKTYNDMLKRLREFTDAAEDK